MDREVTVSVIVTFNELGGTSHHEVVVDFQTALLMLNSDIITHDNRSYRVKYKEVNSQGNVNFYSEDIIRKDSNELRISDIEK